MSKIPTKTPQIPAIPKDVSPEVRRWMESVKEIVEVREGSRGQELDKSVTFRDLLAANVDITNLNIDGAPLKQPSKPGDGDSGTTDPGNVPPWTPPPGMIDPLPYAPTPPTPTSFIAEGGVGIIWVEWDDPLKLYRNHRLTEIFRAANSNNFGNATLIGTAPGANYVDKVQGSYDTYYYWIRFLNIEGVYGDKIGPVAASNVYEVLKDRIITGHLSTTLRKEIETIDDNAAAVQVINKTVGDIEAIYAIKTQVTGSDGKKYVAGFGLISELNKDNGTVESQFVVDVNTFAVIDSSSYQHGGDIQTPFMIGDVTGSDGKTKKMVVIKDAAIGDATITSAKIVDLTADKLKAGTLEVWQLLQFASGNFVIETFVDKYGENACHLVVYDNEGQARVQLGRDPAGVSGQEGYGLQVWGSDGTPQFDANGARVKINDAFIDDLWIGGFKATVPDGNFTVDDITIDLLYDAKTTIQTISYDPQGCKRVQVQIGFEYKIWGNFEVEESRNGCEIHIYAELYAGWKSTPLWRTHVGFIVRGASIMGEDVPDTGTGGRCYFAPQFLLAGHERESSVFSLVLKVEHECYDPSSDGNLNARIDSHISYNRSLLFNGLRDPDSK